LLSRDSHAAGGAEAPRPASGARSGRAILITRPLEDAAVPARRIEALGYRPVIAPLLAVSRRSLRALPAVQAILVTSGNALPSLPAVDLPLLAVGDTTAARARAQGFGKVHSAGRDAQALADLAGRLLDPASGPVLLASGARQGAALAADLRARGFRVLRRVCYTASPVRCFPAVATQAIQAGDLHAVLFLSAETAAAFVRLLPPELNDALASVTALAIGQNAADALEPLPWLRICRAQNPTLDDVLALI
jgi:uroporphyrinogen-III synthase